MHQGTLGFGGVTAVVVGLTADACESRILQQLSRGDALGAAAISLEREGLVVAQSPSVDLTANTGLRSQTFVVSAFALATLLMGVLLARTFTGKRSEQGAMAESSPCSRLMMSRGARATDLSLSASGGVRRTSLRLEAGYEDG